ncbi:MAG: carboxylesterase [Frankiaceae bacterium]|nr:carboxylesterase [Frankiaceae bacterium]
MVAVVPGAEAFSFEGGAVGVLLVHGFTGSPASLRPWGEYLAAEGLTVVCPRLPGHGTRWQDMDRTTWQDWYGEVERAFEDLRRRTEHVFVMGLSMGGTLTLRLAEQHTDEIAGLVLVNPSILTENKIMPALPVVKLVLRSVKSIANDIRKEGADEIAYPRTPLRALSSLVRLWRLTLADLGKVTMPVLYFRSAEDHVVEASNHHTIQSKLGSTDVTEVVLHESYHVATLDHDAPAIFAGSADFVRQHARVGA